MKLITTMPGMIAIAVKASRQLSANRMPTAMPRRRSAIEGDTIAICRKPVVVSTSPVSRDRMPPVFMSWSFASGRWSMRPNSVRRSASIRRVFRSRWRFSLNALRRFEPTIKVRNAVPVKLSRARRCAVSSVLLSRTLSTMNRMNSGSIISSPARTSASTMNATTAARCGLNQRKYSPR